MHFPEERNMKESMTDRIEGTLHELTGGVKQIVGRLADNSDLAAEGQAERIAGTVQKKVGQIKKALDK
jgi:uncharacterized protein YjbJ (UPF0337 family)